VRHGADIDRDAIERAVAGEPLERAVVRRLARFLAFG
jgi:hypothetical protein